MTRAGSRSPVVIGGCLLFTVVILAVGYRAFGFWTMMIFASGFLGGFVIWLMMPGTADFRSIRPAYFATLALFLVHRFEERLSGFFARLEDITGVPTPDIFSWEVILLVSLSVGAWLLVPLAMKRWPDVGRYLAWTFFTSMGLTELAHFVFPLVAGRDYGYFPGMASVILLAPAAWWGMRKLGASSAQSQYKK